MAAGRCGYCRASGAQYKANGGSDAYNLETPREAWRPYRAERSARQRVRKEPLTDASHVRNAIARFDQTVGVSDEDRELAFANIKKAAEHYGVDMMEKNWKELGSRPSTGGTKEDREATLGSWRGHSGRPRPIGGRSDLGLQL